MDTQYFELTKFHYLQFNLQEHHISIYQDQQFTLHFVSMMLLKANIRILSITTYHKLM